MSIAETISALYAIACEADRVASKLDDGRLEPNVKLLKNLLSAVTPMDVEKAFADLKTLLSSLSNLSQNLKNMKIINLTTSADPVNRVIVINTAVIFGNTLVTYDTVFDPKGAQNIIDGLNIALAAIRSPNLSTQEGHA